ncbi:hypothetical protein BJ968_004707 [Kineococcus aurantiacus]|uniref:Ricin B lectin domain-containing protein n=1 Tax=Kineococcus aurantiacus TaxID=37633 RepID=A0A7Y9DQX2_9ACTN|nr:hypothetical protein [Kineococcus aurantiacus]
MAAAAALMAGTSLSAQAYAPTPQTMYQLPQGASCLKGTGNCLVYPKAAQLPSGRLVASFENSQVPSSGTAVGQTLPVYKSDDDGTSWQSLGSIQAPAYMSSDPSVAKYTSNWTNPYLYVLPQDVGRLTKGTLLLASVVSGEDKYYTDQKAGNPSWVPNNDGDRQDVAIALYSSTDGGATWSFQNIVTTGGWQGGSAGAIGQNIAKANTSAQVDPVWEPYLLVYNNQLVAYYSDENDYTGYNTATGAVTLDTANGTARDSYGQILAHRTWDGTSNPWSAAVADVVGNTDDMGSGKTQIGGGRPGMANVVQTSDGKWMLTYEYFGGGDGVHYKVANDPLSFWATGGAGGSNISALPVSAGSRSLNAGGNPVLIRLGDGRLAYNAGSSGDIWVNGSGSSTGTWTQMHTTFPAGYSRNLTYDSKTGRVVILHAVWGSATAGGAITYGETDLGNSAGTYYRITNKATGQVIGTGGNTTDADLGNGNTPDVRLEAAGSAQNTATALWHVQAKRDGSVALLNKASGRSAAVWTGNATRGQQIGSWVDDSAAGPFRMVTKSNGLVYFQSVQNPGLYLTGSAAGAGLTLQPSDNGAGYQDWTLTAQ